MSVIGWAGARPRLPERLWTPLAAAALALAAGLSLLMVAQRDQPSAAAHQAFAAAGRAYQAGRFREAAGLYEGMVRGGLSSAEVLFNLGNAHARDGRVGSAVLAYRQAWRLAPRDPDVAANLRLALQATAAAEADHSAFELAFTGLSRREWAAVAAFAWWAACLLIAAAAPWRRRRRLLLRAAALPAAITAAGLLGLLAWHGLDRRPELVVREETLNVLGAPQASAPPRFSLPEGSIVRWRERQGDWVRISSGQLTGWVRHSSVAPVLPGTTGTSGK